MRASPYPPSDAQCDLAEKLAFLRDPGHYDERPARVDAVETHMSWVFLTDAFAYKLKKPVQTDFLDFRTLAARRRYCEEEVRLNRRLAAQVYLHVSALSRTEEGGLVLEGNGTPVEWLVKMQRLPRELMLDFLLYKGGIGAGEIRRFMRILVDFYRHAEAIEMPRDRYVQRIAEDLATNHRAIARPQFNMDAEKIARIRQHQERFLQRHSGELTERVAQGRIIEAHGDLRPEHICLTPVPVFIDCLEFNREFRLLDPAHELAYLAMECDYLHAPFADAVIFDAYHEGTQDTPSRSLVEFYKSERAILRVKLALWHLLDRVSSEQAKWVSRAGHYLDLAEVYCMRW